MAWTPALDADGTPRPDAQVAELTGLLRHSAGGDRPAGWPAVNTAWCQAKAEPKTLRYRILHTAGRIVKGQRRHHLKNRGALALG